MLGFLKKMFGGGSGFRSTLEAHPPLTAAVTAMKGSNVQPALQLFHATDDPELRYLLVDVTASRFGAADTRMMLLDAWVKNTPNDPFAALVRARWAIESAPSWRPNDPAEVADAARAANHQAAEMARSVYEQIADAAPHDPLPHALSLDLPLVWQLEGKRRLYDRIMHMYPPFFSAHLAMHHALTAMWYGSHEQSIGFARSVSAAAPIGSDLHVLVVNAHHRVIGYERFYGEGEGRAKQLLADQQIDAEVHDALGKSLWSPQYRPGHWSLWARHVAAAWFNEHQDKQRARAELEHVGDAFDEDASPWYMSADGYAGIRRELGL